MYFVPKDVPFVFWFPFPSPGCALLLFSPIASKGIRAKLRSCRPLGLSHFFGSYSCHPRSIWVLHDFLPRFQFFLRSSPKSVPCIMLVLSLTSGNHQLPPAPRKESVPWFRPFKFVSRVCSAVEGDILNSTTASIPASCLSILPFLKAPFVSVLRPAPVLVLVCLQCPTSQKSSTHRRVLALTPPFIRGSSVHPAQWLLCACMTPPLFRAPGPGARVPFFAPATL